MVANKGMEAEKQPVRRRARATFFAIRLGECMKDIDLSGAEVARRAGISPRQLNYYVSGDREPSLLIAKRIASILKVPLDDLIDSKSLSKSRDRETYIALERFYHLCEELGADDVSMLVDVAEFAASRRREEAKRYMAMELPPACERLMRVHHVLIPEILRKAATPRLYTEINPRPENDLWVQIHLIFDEPGRRSGLLTELVRMARSRLDLSKDLVATREPEPKALSMEICLGPAPDPARLTKPKKKPVRHRARPLSLGP